MLREIGYTSFDDLFSEIPSNVKIDKLNLPAGKSELEVRRDIEKIAGKNQVFTHIFRGAGAYNHYIPSIVKSVTSKEEFITSYTPYQAEISQGTLQSIFEYQTMICQLTGMDVSNASVYDGASAAAEALAMCKDRRRSKMLVSLSANPMVIDTIKAYCEGSDTPVEFIPVKDGVTDLSALEEMLDDNTAGVYVHQPNFFGQLEDIENITKLVQDNRSKMIMGINPIAGALLKTPGEMGVDIAVGEGQPLGLPLGFGGPYLGFMACKQNLMRKLPGRIVGQTVDSQGRRAFVLTLQAREQHIRREKASSNICTNQALCAMTAAVYLSAVGKKGIRQVANLCVSKAHYAKEQITKINGFDLVYTGEFFNEFVTTTPISAKELIALLAKKDILGGYPVEGGILWCVTEMNTKEDIHLLVETLKEVEK